MQRHIRLHDGTMIMERRKPPDDVEFVNGDFAKLKELIMFRLNTADAERKELSDKVDRYRVEVEERIDVLADKMQTKFEALTNEVRTDRAKQGIVNTLLKIKITGLAAISSLITSAITGALVAYEFLRKWKGP